MFSEFPPPPQKKGAVYEIMWKNIVVTDKVTDDGTTHALRMLGN